MVTPLYSVATWDEQTQGFTPQAGLPKTFNLTRAELRVAIRALRGMGYTAHRYRGPDGDHDSDPCVLIERTDGMTETEILRAWGVKKQIAQKTLFE